MVLLLIPAAVDACPCETCRAGHPPCPSSQAGGRPKRSRHPGGVGWSRLHLLSGPPCCAKGKSVVSFHKSSRDHSEGKDKRGLRELDVSLLSSQKRANAKFRGRPEKRTHHASPMWSPHADLNRLEQTSKRRRLWWRCQQACHVSAACKTRYHHRHASEALDTILNAAVSSLPGPLV